MDEAIQLTGELPSLRDPLALVALWGLGDGTGSALGAVRHLREKWAADEVAAVDSDRFYDLSVARPRRLQRGDDYLIRWPSVRFYAAHPPSAPRDVVLISGREPHLRWRDFTEGVASFLDEAGARDVLLLTSRPGAVPHTRPTPVTLSDADPAFEQALGERSEPSSYQGPTSMATVLLVALRQRGLRTGRLAALIPDYVNFGPNPRAVLALAHSVDALLGTDTDAAAVVASLQPFNEQVDQAISSEPSERDIRAHIAELEERYDRDRDSTTGSEAESELPSSNELLRGIDELLREREDEEPRGGSGP